MNDEELDQQTIALYEAEVARWRSAGYRATRYTVRVLLVLCAVATFMYVTGLIDGIR